MLVEGNEWAAPNATFVYQPLGDAVLTGDYWRLLLEINCTRILDDVRDLSSTVRHLEIEARRIGEKIPELKGVQAELMQLCDITDELVEEVDNLAEMLPRGRPKRGLLNAGGKLIKFLFGNPDQDDFEGIRADIECIEKTQGRLVHVAQEQVTLSRRMGMQLTEVGRKVTGMVQAVTLFMQESSTRLGALEHQVHNTHILLNQSLFLSMNLRNVGLVATRYKAELLGLRTAVEYLTQGRVSFSLLSPREFSGVLSGIAEILPVGLSMLSETGTADVHLYYGVTKVQAISTTTGIHVVLDIPLQSADQRLKLMAVIEQPMLDTTGSQLMMMRRESEYLLVGENGKNYALMKEREIAQCRPGRIWICPAVVPLYRRQRASCVSSVYFGDEEGIRKSCVWFVLAKDPGPIWTWREDKESWAYTLLRPTTAQIQCRDRGNLQGEERTLQGVGEIKLGRGCLLRTSDYLLLPTSDGITNVSLTWKTHPTTVTAPPGPVQARGDSEISRMALRQLIQSGQVRTDEWGPDRIEWDRLQEEVEAMVRGEQQRGVRRWGLMTVAGVSLALVIIGSWLWYCGWRKRIQDRSGAPAEEPEEEYQIRYPGEATRTVQSRRGSTI